MRYLIPLAALLLAGSAAMAQDAAQGSNPEFLQHVLSALQAQRNRALDEAATAEAQLSQAQKAITDLQRQLVDKTKPEPPKP